MTRIGPGGASFPPVNAAHAEKAGRPAHHAGAHKVGEDELKRPESEQQQPPANGDPTRFNGEF